MRVILVALTFLSATAYAGTTLVFTTPHDEPTSTSRSDGFIDQVVTQAIERTGNHLKIVHLPAERALINANEGIDDGVLHRVAGLSENYHNLVQAQESTSTMSFVAFTRNPDIQIRNWTDLKKYSVAIITGWKILEKSLLPGTRVVKVRNPEQLFFLLQKNRTEVILYGKWQGLYYLKKHKIQGVRMLSPPLAKELMYVYFNKKYGRLEPEFSRALRDMKRDGSWQRIFNSTLKPLMLGINEKSASQLH